MQIPDTNYGAITVTCKDSLTNSGTNSAPEFRDYQLMEAGGGHLEVVHAHPDIFDLDNDALKDLLCGNENGYIYFFKNSGTNQTPFFEAVYETLMTVDSVFIDGYTNSRVHFCDWTDDGDLDIILGGQDGYVWLCENATITGIKEFQDPGISPPSFHLMSNPVTNIAHFQCTIQRPTWARLALYSIAGVCIDILPLVYLDTGLHLLEWQVSDNLGTGIYIAVLAIEGSSHTTKVLVIR